MGLEFEFAKLEDEIRYFTATASGYLDPTAEPAMQAWLSQLQGIRSSKDNSQCRWSIPETRPIKTLACSSEQNSHDPNVFGKMSMAWDVRIPQGAARDKGRRARSFCLDGVTATKVSLWRTNDDGSEKEVARWSFEVGSETSPGAHFHVQVKGDEGDRLFSPALSIPRFPAILVTPIDSLDFLLGEVFQTVWRRHLASESTELLSWASIQRSRMQKIYDWQGSHIRQSRGACWNQLKHAKPTTKLLI